MTTPLFSLPPCGLGTWEVESLTSYARRLAAAHVVSPNTLLREAVLKPHRAYRGQRHLVFEPSRIGESLNGTGVGATLVIRYLQVLTGIRSLASMTVVSLAPAIEFRSSFRTFRAWCPSCLVSGEPYDRLAWALLMWRACPTHQLKLQDECVRCRRRHRPLAPMAHPALCPHCAGDLISFDDGSMDHIPDDAIPRGLVSVIL